MFTPPVYTMHMHMTRSSMLPFTQKFVSERAFGVAGLGIGEKFQGLWSSVFVFSHLACR